MADGRQKRDANDLKGALHAFEAADALMHVPTTTFEVARTKALLGLLVEARDLALHVARTPAAPGEPPPFAEARASAQKLADDLEARIPSLRIALKNGQGAIVTIDDIAVPTIAMGLGRRLDPGTHVIVAKLGATERRVSVQLLEREAKEVPVDLAEPNTTTTVTIAPLPTVVETPSSHRPPWVAVGVAGLALGGASIAVGAITGAMSLSQTSSIKSQCNGNTCPATLSGGQSTTSAISNANTLATISDITFIAGGVLAAAGATFVVLGASRKSDASVSVGFLPTGFLVSGVFQ